MTHDTLDCVVPEWPAPRRVHAFATTRAGGISVPPFGAPEGGGLNLGLGSGDLQDAVMANRARLAACLPSPPAWLHQVHGSRVVAADPDVPVVEADASWTAQSGRVCAVLMADCLPVLFCDRDGTRVAAAHAGWRGLCGGVLERTLDVAGFDPATTMAWLGPAIGPAAFEVGDDVRDAFLDDVGGRAMREETREQTIAAFAPHAPGKWLADLPGLARIRLCAAGVPAVFASDLCTVTDPRRFYSYRRDGVTGRMAALIWLDD